MGDSGFDQKALETKLAKSNLEVLPAHIYRRFL